MVLWEITLGTAYFLGLKRTFRLALKLQRRLINPKYPRIRQFAQRRTRTVFDVALKVHKNIQERDLEAGRNLGNRILRWLDKMKPSAEIRGKSLPGGIAKTSTTKQLTRSSNPKNPESYQRCSVRSGDRESDKHLFISSRNFWPKPFPAMTIMKPAKPIGTNIQYRPFSVCNLEALNLNHVRHGCQGVIRKDIMLWMQN